MNPNDALDERGPARPLTGNDRSPLMLLWQLGAEPCATILAYAIAFMGLIMIGGGVWGLFLLVKTSVRPPLRYFAMAIGMISGGFAMGGLAQALRLLVAISGHG